MPDPTDPCGDSPGARDSAQDRPAVPSPAVLSPAVLSPAARLVPLLRRNWLAGLLFAVGLALRVLTQESYHPALLYVDSVKYLYGAWPGGDPLGYDVPLKAILAVGGLGAVEAVQHLLGLAMAVTLYLVLLRRGVPRWLAAIAIAPVLLDAYQLEMEATIMPNVWFEALIVAGLAVLLRKPATSLLACVVAGLALGASATVWQPGEILVVPLVLFVAAAAGGWRQALARGAAGAAAFALPVLAYCTWSLALTGHFWLSDNGLRSSYGRVAEAADCATLRLPAYERALCPTAAARAHGPDWLDHDSQSPLKTYQPPPGMSRRQTVSGFIVAVAEQQPLRVLAGYASDAAKLFAAVRVTDAGDTPISRWQFQNSYPSFPPTINVSSKDGIVLGLILRSSGGPLRYETLRPAYGGRALVWAPGAKLLRAYQRHGGYTPGPLLLLAVLAGLAGSLAVLRRRTTAARRQLTLGCLLFFGAGVAVLLMSDVGEFSWRYQLLAIVTLPPAGALSLAALPRYARRRGAERPSGHPASPADRLAAHAG
ncbi:MAG TPA: hypothetical protein VN840_11960 [Streptosporangiaceae bacterium]|nr:hypothetical protein [Streptosporangiaceae bacterium]